VACICSLCLLAGRRDLIRSGRVSQGFRLLELALEWERARIEREQPLGLPPCMAHDVRVPRGRFEGRPPRARLL
jgi:hypothetical protein